VRSRYTASAIRFIAGTSSDSIISPLCETADELKATACVTSVSDDADLSAARAQGIIGAKLPEA